jgi:hypothetical protein
MTLGPKTALWAVLTCSICVAQNCPQDQPKGINPPVPAPQNPRVCRYDRSSDAAQPSYWWQLLYELFKWKPAGRPPFRRSIAFLAGVSHYNHITPQLDFVRSDLKDLRNFLLTEGGFDTVYEVRDGNVSREVFDGFMKGYFSDPRGPVAPEDRLLVYYSGHGGAQADVEPYLLFEDASPGVYTRDVLDVKDVYSWANTIVAKHLLIILDSCFSGLARDKTAPEDMTVALSNSLAGEPSGLLLTAGTGDERAYALQYSRDKNGSIFTHALIDAMKNVSQSEGIVTIGEAFERAKVSVAAFSAVENKKMHPLATPLLRQGAIGSGNFIFINSKAQNPLLPSGINGGGSAIAKATDNADPNLSLIQKEYEEVKSSDNLAALRTFVSTYKGKLFGQTLVYLIEERINRLEHSATVQVPTTTSTPERDVADLRRPPISSSAVTVVGTPSGETLQPANPVVGEKSLAEVTEFATKQISTNPQLSLALALYAAQKLVANGKNIDPAIESVLYNSSGAVRTVSMPGDKNAEPDSAAFSPDGKYLAIAGPMGTCLANITNGDTTCPAPLRDGRLFSWSLRDDKLVAGGAQLVLAYDVTTGTAKALRNNGKEHKVTAVAYGSSRIFFNFDNSKDLGFWQPFRDPKDIIFETSKWSLKGEKGQVLALAEPPGKGYFTTGGEGRIEFWGPGVFPPIGQGSVSGDVRQILYSRDGVRLAVAADFGKGTNVVLLEPGYPRVQPKILYTLTAGAGAVLALNNDGSRLALRESSRVLLFVTPKYSISLPHGIPAFSPDGNTLVIADSSSIMFYPGSPTALLAHAKTKSRNLTADECKEYLGLETCPQ